MKRPQLNLRDFFWLALVVALVLGWRLDRVPLAKGLAAERRSNTELAKQAARARADLLHSLEQQIKLLKLCQDRGMVFEVDDLVRILGEDAFRMESHAGRSDSGDSN
jgi:hypothetical protein